MHRQEAPIAVCIDAAGMNVKLPAFPAGAR
jgi:hypothetical protein